MINKVSIRNFKSVEHLELDLGRFNVFIGENGCGKSNILEGVAFGALASEDKLDGEFFEARGIRTKSDEDGLFKSAFDKTNFENPIVIEFNHSDSNNSEKSFTYTLNKKSEHLKLWKLQEKEDVNTFTDYLWSFINNNVDDTQKRKEIDDVINQNPILSGFLSNFKSLGPHLDVLKALDESIVKDAIEKLIIKNLLNPFISQFRIYSPENTSLRNFYDEKAAWPLGITGSGIFNLLNHFKNFEPELIEKINERLYLIEWFGGFEIPTDSVSGEKKISVFDKYLDINVSNFTQRNVNEGFLFLLFYITLFISKDTPSFFAIDNIEASFHPKLCKKMIQELVVLSKEHNKQALTTTHNPFILDGLDLNDPEQRLFVVYRNKEGKTKARRIEAAERDYDLSYAWINGFLGGVPNNFTV